MSCPASPHLRSGGAAAAELERHRSRGSPSRGLPAHSAVLLPHKGRLAARLGRQRSPTAWHTPRWHRVGVACGAGKLRDSGDCNDSAVRQLRRAGAPMRTARPGAALGAPCPSSRPRRPAVSWQWCCRLPEHAVCAMIQPHRNGTGPSGADKLHPRPFATHVKLSLLGSCCITQRAEKQLQGSIVDRVGT